MGQIIEVIKKKFWRKKKSKSIPIVKENKNETSGQNSKTH